MVEQEKLPFWEEDWEARGARMVCGVCGVSVRGRPQWALIETPIGGPNSTERRHFVLCEQRDWAHKRAVIEEFNVEPPRLRSFKWYSMANGLGDPDESADA